MSLEGPLHVLHFPCDFPFFSLVSTSLRLVFTVSISFLSVLEDLGVVVPQTVSGEEVSDVYWK